MTVIDLLDRTAWLGSFLLCGGIQYASVAMNHGAGSLSDDCRSHCAPIATRLLAIAANPGACNTGQPASGGRDALR